MIASSMLTACLAGSLSLVPLPQSAAADAPSPNGAPAPIRTLLVTGANNHDWKWTSPVIAEVLRESGRFEVAITEDPATDLQDIAKRHANGEVDLIVLDYNGKRWGDAAEASFTKAVRAGCGVTVLHAADNAFPGWTDYEQLVGLLWRKGAGHGRYHAFDVHVVDHAHPITRGMRDLRLHPDELYHRLTHAEGANYRVLMSAFSDPKSGGTGRHEPMATAGSFGKGRIFHTPLGHVWRKNVPSHATWHDPQLRHLVARGSEWAATGSVTLPSTPPNRLSAAENKQGFELLFNGKDLSEWRSYKSADLPSKGWSVQEHVLVHAENGGGGDLVTRKSYGDFDFRFSFRISKNGNSGVMWHVTDGQPETYFSGPEFQILDDEGSKPNELHAAGALYGLVPARNKTLRPAGRWNQGRIVVHKGRVQHWLNGTKVVDAPCLGPEWERMVAGSKFKDWPFGQASEGRLALQDHGNEVAFRSMRIRRL